MKLHNVIWITRYPLTIFQLLTSLLVAHPIKPLKLPLVYEFGEDANARSPLLVQGGKMSMDEFWRRVEIWTTSESGYSRRHKAITEDVKRKITEKIAEGEGFIFPNLGHL